MRLLLVEDDRDIARFLQRGLEEEGFQVTAAHDGDRAWQLLQSGGLDLLLLDLMVPGRSGRDLIDLVRQAGWPLPILVLSARDGVADRVDALNAGADDYLVKPFAFDELLARARALLRRGRELGDRVVRLGRLTIDRLGRTAELDGLALELSPREFELLDCFARHPDEVLSRTRLHEQVWQAPYDGQSNVVDVYVQYLRRKTEQGHGPRLIETVRGRGYRLAASALQEGEDP